MALLNNATHIYLGTAPVAKVMVGATQVWPSTAVAAPATPAFTQISVNSDTVSHQFNTVANATVYRIEIEKVG